MFGLRNISLFLSIAAPIMASAIPRQPVLDLAVRAPSGSAVAPPVASTPAAAYTPSPTPAPSAAAPPAAPSVAAPPAVPSVELPPAAPTTLSTAVASPSTSPASSPAPIGSYTPISPAPTSSTAAASPSASAPANSYGGDQITCQTTSGSPLLSDCQQIDFSTVSMSAQGLGSGCNNVGSYGTCALSLCQPDDVFGDYSFYDSSRGFFEGMAEALLARCPNYSPPLIGGIIDNVFSNGGYIHMEFVHT